MRRREFLRAMGLLAAWPLMALAQQQQPKRRVGALLNRAADDPESADRVDAFSHALTELGWTIGSNVEIEYRYAAGTVAAFRKAAAELIDLKPDVLLVSGTLGVAAVRQSTSSIPVVFNGVADPLGAGIVDSLAKPGGNITGFMNFEYSFNAKMLELLKQIVPNLARAAVLRNSENPTGIAQFVSIQTVAPSIGVDVVAINLRDAAEIERSIAGVARSPNCGLIVTGSASATNHHDLIIALAAKYKLPAVYVYRYSAMRGGLISYGPDLIDQFRLAATYVDRILKGEKPGDLPVQAPTKYLLVINLKTAKSLGLQLPPSLLARADEVIE
jgi:putative ABC transport system substrate-binding protein